jgi:2'-5' RNA ligase
LGVSIDVRAVTLFRTVQGKDGVSYEVIDRFGLGRL